MAKRRKATPLDRQRVFRVTKQQARYIVERAKDAIRIVERYSSPFGYNLTQTPIENLERTDLVDVEATIAKRGAKLSQDQLDFLEDVYKWTKGSRGRGGSFAELYKEEVIESALKNVYGLTGQYKWQNLSYDVRNDYLKAKRELESLTDEELQELMTDPKFEGTHNIKRPLSLDEYEGGFVDAIRTRQESWFLEGIRKFKEERGIKYNAGTGFDWESRTKKKKRKSRA